MSFQAPDRNEQLFETWFILKLTYGIVPIVAGVDKFFNYLTLWEQYVNPLLLKLIPLPMEQFLHVVGIIEIVAGLLVLSSLTGLGAYIVMFWLFGIAAQLVANHMYYDTAIRDVALAIGAYVLAQLTAIRNETLHDTTSR